MSNATTLQTNNNKLSANNTDLATILNTINNLPEAGGGGSGGGDFATGSILTPINKTTKGQVLETVSGLSFTPNKVIVKYMSGLNSSTINSSGLGTILLCDVCNIDGVQKCTVSIADETSKVKIQGNSDYFLCNIIENGFEIVSNTATGRVPGPPRSISYEYFAFRT